MFVIFTWYLGILFMWEDDVLHAPPERPPRLSPMEDELRRFYPAACFCLEIQRISAAFMEKP